MWSCGDSPHPGAQPQSYQYKKRCFYCFYHLGNHKDFRSSVPATRGRDQHMYFVLSHTSINVNQVHFIDKSFHCQYLLHTHFLKLYYLLLREGAWESVNIKCAVCFFSLYPCQFSHFWNSKARCILYDCLVLMMSLYLHDY